MEYDMESVVALADCVPVKALSVQRIWPAIKLDQIRDEVHAVVG
jgi:hypothetical protein